LQSFNNEEVHSIAKILLLNKDLHYEVLYAAPAANNQTTITGLDSAQTAETVPAHRLQQAIISEIISDQRDTRQPERELPHFSSSNQTSLKNNVSGKSGENDEFSGKGD